MLGVWREMSWYRRILLIVLAVMIAGFGIATLAAGGREGMEYQNTLLRFTQEGEVRRYTGRVDGKGAEFTVRPGGRVEYRWGRRSTVPTRWRRTPPPPLSPT